MNKNPTKNKRRVYSYHKVVSTWKATEEQKDKDKVNGPVDWKPFQIGAFSSINQMIAIPTAYKMFDL